MRDAAREAGIGAVDGKAADGEKLRGETKAAAWARLSPRRWNPEMTGDVSAPEA